jgi:hypothetical protein
MRSPVDFAAARALGGVIKPIAAASFDPDRPGAWVGPALVDDRHAAAASRRPQFLGSTRRSRRRRRRTYP